MITAIVLIGAPGAGKSSVLQALGTRLEREGRAYGSIESEQLSMGWPSLPGDVWTASLADVLARQRAAGRELFVVAATPETPEELAAVVSATSAPAASVICLCAPPDTVAARIDAREPDAWPGKQRLVAHARRLAHWIPTFPGISATISTVGRAPADVADEVRALSSL